MNRRQRIKAGRKALNAYVEGWAKAIDLAYVGEYLRLEVLLTDAAQKDYEKEFGKHPGTPISIKRRTDHG